jgi:hypothetical protein
MLHHNPKHVVEILQPQCQTPPHPPGQGTQITLCSLSNVAMITSSSIIHNDFFAHIFSTNSPFMNVQAASSPGIDNTSVRNSRKFAQVCLAWI